MTNVVAPRRRRLLGMACAALAGASIGLSLSACASSTFPFIPDHYTFSREQVQAAVARKFPYRHTVSQLFNVALTNPIVGFEPGSNRVTVHVDAHVESPFLQQPVDGGFLVTSQLQYDEPSHAVVLRSPSVERVDVGGEARAYRQQIEAAGALAAAQWLDGYPIYTFKPEQLQFGGVNFEPGTITILTNGIRVQIVEK
ncbi:DUF1439 domain-containing protein [Trinickia diaoshuihuensis]|jgi:hypothetical protein|uniref:DUF1439 domain-containing protein n=1 Tax=Trinickia diaoshuihuensis TaxID=2292265 RepID=UPI000E260D30|nr:DUF1439 domain-containing protein [Trinickia diaoshuihuensis]